MAEYIVDTTDGILHARATEELRRLLDELRKLAAKENK